VRTLVVYDSAFGNTGRIARAIGDAASHFGETRVANPQAIEPLACQRADVLFMGAPTQLHRMSEPMRAFLKALPRGLLDGVPAAAFDTRLLRSRWLTGSAASGVAREFRRLGCRLVVAPESFFVLGREGPLEPGEEERAGRWARTVLLQAEGSRART
jgi:menaquinone-dependent protoporphyrinogen IX oxidase